MYRPSARTRPCLGYHLPGDPQVVLLHLSVIFRWGALVGHVRPRVRVERVLVLKDASERVRTIEAGREPEPRFVFRNRAANRFVQIPNVVDLVRRRQPSGLELVGVVGPLHRLVRECEECRIAERVSAVLRDEVDADSTRRPFGGQRRGVDGNFGSGSHVGLLAADVAAGLQRHDADAVQHHALIDSLAAVCRKALSDVRDAGAPAHVTAAAGRTSRHSRQREVLSGARQVLDCVVIEHDLFPRAGRVDNWRLARDGDRFRHGAHAQLQLSVDRGRKRPGQLDAVTSRC